ncbi:hypothetical protein B0H13DRAFT_2577852 [Mycena leptocephala]|nr:hypothetical protein B0H13DRAFT_2577852 [Mycena leptocephala]
MTLGDVKVIMVFGLLKQNLRHCLKLELQSGRTAHYLRGANKLVECEESVGTTGGTRERGGDAFDDRGAAAGLQMTQIPHIHLVTIRCVPPRMCAPSSTRSVSGVCSRSRHTISPSHYYLKTRDIQRSSSEATCGGSTAGPGAGGLRLRLVCMYRTEARVLSSLVSHQILVYGDSAPPFHCTHQAHTPPMHALPARRRNPAQPPSRRYIADEDESAPIVHRAVWRSRIQYSLPHCSSGAAAGLWPPRAQRHSAFLSDEKVAFLLPRPALDTDAHRSRAIPALAALWMQSMACESLDGDEDESMVTVLPVVSFVVGGLLMRSSSMPTPYLDLNSSHLHGECAPTANIPPTHPLSGHPTRHHPCRRRSCCVPHCVKWIWLALHRADPGRLFATAHALHSHVVGTIAHYPLSPSPCSEGDDPRGEAAGRNVPAVKVPDWLEQCIERKAPKGYEQVVRV